MSAAAGAHQSATAAGAHKSAAATRPAAAPRSRAPHRAAPCVDAALQPTGTDLAQINTATLCLINRVRATDRLRKLRFSSQLQSVAMGQAQDMVAGDYFGDESPTGLTPLQRIWATRYPSGALRVSTAQNIGWATGPLATPTGIVQAWMESPPHRKIMLTASYIDIGVGVAPAAPSSLSEGLSGATYTIEFAQRIFAARAARHR